MTIEAQYAAALFDLVTRSPEKSGEYLTGLKTTLQRKGHQKLMPRIFAEYERIATSRERSKTYAEVTPESERTRILLELYRSLVASA